MIVDVALVEFAYQEPAGSGVIECVCTFAVVFGPAGNCRHRRGHNELQRREFTAPSLTGLVSKSAFDLPQQQRIAGE
jgi:hypothetical protein